MTLSREGFLQDIGKALTIQRTVDKLKNLCSLWEIDLDIYFGHLIFGKNAKGIPGEKGRSFSVMVWKQLDIYVDKFEPWLLLHIVHKNKVGF